MSNSNHPEWEKVNSLTSRNDRGDGKYKSDMGAPPLTEQEVQNAINQLVDTSLVDKFPRHERQYADPPIHLQTYGLFSFTPSKGATPDKDGVYGFAKIRGNYGTPQEAMERSEFLIRNVDSYHQIYQAYVGRPFPITLDPKYAAKVEEVDIKKKATEVISADVKAKRDREKQDIDEIKEREQKLLAEAKPDYVPDPYEKYTVLRVKKAQLVWGYSQTMKQLEDMKKIIIKTREEICVMDSENPEYKNEYFEKYQKARRDAGIPDEHNTEDNFVKYMVEDIDLGF
jgi:hypothetical protein